MEITSRTNKQNSRATNPTSVRFFLSVSESRRTNQKTENSPGRPKGVCLHRILQKKEEKLAVAVRLEDACNRVQFKLLMELLAQYGVSLTLTRWLAAALQDKKGRHTTRKLDIHTPKLTMGLPQAPPPPPLSPVLYNVYRKGLADLNSNGLIRVLTLVDHGLIYKIASGTHTTVTTVQEQLQKVSHWCQETESEINPSTAQALWCTLNNKAVGQSMQAVSFNGEVIERKKILRYFGIHFDRMLT